MTSLIIYLPKEHFKPGMIVHAEFQIQIDGKSHQIPFARLPEIGPFINWLQATPLGKRSENVAFMPTDENQVSKLSGRTQPETGKACNYRLLTGSSTSLVLRVELVIKTSMLAPRMRFPCFSKRPT
jgi:hypothetical protein